MPSSAVNIFCIFCREERTPIQNLIRPKELKNWSGETGLEFVRLASLMYNPFTRKFKVAAGKEDVNYMVHFAKEN